MTLVEIRCSECNKKLCEANPEAKIKATCSRCKNSFVYPGNKKLINSN